jgi:hypothetical protein
VIVSVAEEEQAPLMPVTVYVVVLVGVTEMLLPLRLPGIQLYVVAPLADKVEEPPEQSVVCVAEAVTTGVGFTVMVTRLVSVQPPDVPVTV